MKNIVILNRSLLLGGAEKQCVNLAKELKGHHNIYLVLLDDSIDKRFQAIVDEYDIKLHILKGNIFSQIYDLAKFCRRHQIDIIFSYLFGSNVIAGFAGKLSGVPKIIGGWRGSITTGKLQLSIFWILHKFFLNYIIINNHQGKKYFKSKGFNGKKFSVIHNGIEVADVKSNPKTTGPLTLLTVGRFDEAKDYATSLKVFHKVQQKCEYLLKYRIVGYGEKLAMIEDLIHRYDLEKTVQVYIKPDNLEEIYRTSDIYLSTSIYEGLSNTIMEAMNFSLPIVATRVGDNKYMVKPDENGFLCEPQDVECLSDSILKLANERSLIRKMGNKSHQIISDNFSMSTLRSNYLNLIASLY